MVENLTGEIIPLDVEPCDTISRLKDLIQDKDDTMVKHRLIFDGEELEDSRTISDYNLENLSVVQMVLKNEPRDAI